jgi:hypothetical protein
MHCNSSIKFTNNRLSQWLNLLFFVLILLSPSCVMDPPNPNIVWKDSKAVGISVPYGWVGSMDEDSIRHAVTFVLSGDKNKTAVMGNYTFNNHTFLFEPLIPFTRGMKYEAYVHDRKIWDFGIFPPETGAAPAVKAVYPMLDTVPENILKIYIEFSQPMREGGSAKYVSLIKNDNDTLRNVFLDLQPELWNENRTVLTLWLDPGRIKRDLQPNLKLGAPLHAKDKYKLFVSSEWPNAQGRVLQHSFNWPFTTAVRNETSPDPNKWKITLPSRSSQEALWVSFDKPLDHFLLGECIHVKDASGKMIKGKIIVSPEDRGCRFTPEHPWAAGKYEIAIDSKLEDLCGNNLNRPFDRDITKTKTPSVQTYHAIPFTIL